MFITEMLSQVGQNDERDSSMLDGRKCERAQTSGERSERENAIAMMRKTEAKAHNFGAEGCVKRMGLKEGREHVLLEGKVVIWPGSSRTERGGDANRLGRKLAGSSKRARLVDTLAFEGEIYLYFSSRMMFPFALES